MNVFPFFKKKLRTESKLEYSHTEHATKPLQSTMGVVQESQNTTDTESAVVECAPNCHADQATSMRRPRQRHKRGWNSIGAARDCDNVLGVLERGFRDYINVTWECFEIAIDPQLLQPARHREVLSHDKRIKKRPPLRLPSKFRISPQYDGVSWT